MVHERTATAASSEEMRDLLVKWCWERCSNYQQLAKRKPRSKQALYFRAKAGAFASAALHWDSIDVIASAPRSFLSSLAEASD